MKSVNATIASLALLGIMAGPALAQSAGSDEMKGRHAMQGQITSLDEKKGWVHVKTADGTMIVHYPPAQLQSVKKGDMVTLQLALKDNGPAPKK